MGDVSTFIYDPRDLLIGKVGSIPRGTRLHEFCAMIELQEAALTRLILVNPSVADIRSIQKSAASAEYYLILIGREFKSYCPLLNRGIIFDRLWREVWLPTREFESASTRFYRDESEVARSISEQSA